MFRVVYIKCVYTRQKQKSENTKNTTSSQKGRLATPSNEDQTPPDCVLTKTLLDQGELKLESVPCPILILVGSFYMKAVLP